MTSLPEFPSDRASCVLPHPLRAQRFLEQFLVHLERGVGEHEWLKVRAAFEQPDFLLANLPQYIDENRLYRFKGFFETAAHAPGSTELGGAMATLVGVRHLVSPYRLFRVEDSLVELLGLTDMDRDIPVGFLKLPYPRCYVELGQSRTIEAHVPNDLSGLHVLEGAYLEQGRHPQRGSGIYVMATGSPLGKRDCMDDATHAVFLSTEDPDKSISVALEEAFEVALEQSAAGGYRAPSRDSFQESLRTLQWLIKALLYISLPEARRTLHLERTEYLQQIQGLRSPGKRVKALRKLARLSDTVVIHAPSLPREDSLPTAAGAGLARVAHWRRGHYRQQAHGPQLSQRKLIFIAPMRVGGAEPESVVKTYAVR